MVHSCKWANLFFFIFLLVGHSFITFGSCKHLDGKHTVFGKLVGGMAVLDKMEAVPTDEQERPIDEISIKEAVVFVDPFEEFEKAVGGKKRKQEDVAAPVDAESLPQRIKPSSDPSVGKMYRRSIAK